MQKSRERARSADFGHSESRGMSSARLHGRVRKSSCGAMIFSQPVSHA
jgi:hypothetical protein